ncbi:MAG: aminotransferase class IV, partial [Alphaproteobacteria bacterium]|nr:aminotransferase class IV [Alphaproteobacteria bacterium]
MNEQRGTHHYQDDPRNADVLIYVHGELVPRARAMVSVFDSGFILGDGVWEGLRLHNGHFAFLDEHLKRLWQGAKAIDLDLGMSR